MAITTFRSAYGPYNVTQAVLAKPPRTNTEGTTTQAIVTFETTDQTEAVSIIGATLFLGADGHKSSASYDGQRRTLGKTDARKQYRSILAQGYSPSTALIY
jgi:YD repeat-containing protein